VQEVIITVDGGYRSDRVVVIAGQLVKLLFDRHDSNACLDELLIPDECKKVRQPLTESHQYE
jgi:plastocyanin domain-containing protein